MGVEAGFAKKCQNLPKETLDDLVEVLFYNEVYRRRLRRRRGKDFIRNRQGKYFWDLRF